MESFRGMGGIAGPRRHEGGEVTISPGTDWATREGALAVYPSHGVVRIDGVCLQEISGREVEMLALRLIEDDSRIFVPLDRAEGVGLREVISKEEAEEIWKTLAGRGGRSLRSGGPWSRRFRDYQEKVRRGSVFDVAEVLADLMHLQLEKELSFGEQRLLDTARSRIVHEIAAAENRSPESVEADLRSLLS
jgi:CarD family transcriptional regulator